MATFIKVTQEGNELLRRNKEQTQGQRLNKLESDEQRRIEQQARELRRQALLQQGLDASGNVLGGGRRQRFRPDEPAATFFPVVKADFYVIRYGFTTGEDLDTRTKIQNPVTKELLGPVGWCKDDEIIVDDVPIVVWSGDNTGTGFESVLFDRVAYETVFGESQTTIVLQLNAFWYDLKGTDVIISITGYLGGAMVKNDELFTWDNPTALKVYSNFSQLRSTTVQTNESSCIDGDFISYLVIDYAKGSAAYTQVLAP